ncbi:ThiF family protein [Caloramator fervidus]|uniref:ThiF family protein n=1 Tax=Caloramator fervidus TaxID=29344 RepID=A0A1H5UAN8_9CLOT|nr:ThiF family adenylyltransferase [Caloramator fervidus]SEF72100.1 ThiF family protein [Caloramator fervidus]
MFEENDIDRYKVEVDFEKLEKINSEILFQAYIDKINEHNIHAYCHDCDILIDKTSNINITTLLNNY